MNMFSIESECIKTDVTAVKILRKHCLVGIGGYLHVFEKNSYKLFSKIVVFQGQKIYEIIPNETENVIIIHGGKCIKIITVDKNFMVVSETASKIYSDWILAAKWIDNYERIATISMHNTLQIWDANLELITRINCEEKCILYSAFICYDKFKELVVLSGTVFSEVLIWRPSTERDSPVLTRLQKHKGVIFSVHYNESSGFICSSSDDRSAILWKPKSTVLLTELEQENIEIHIACHVFGHLSRVFRCLVLRESFLTVGEDSLVNVWTFDGRLIRKIETHQGGPVWAIDANEDENIILTGGSDCAATLFPISYNFKEEVLTMPNEEIPKCVGYLASNNLIIFSESGTLYHYVKKKHKWLRVQTFSNLKRYCLMAVSKCRNLVALAGFDGQIYIYKEENDKIYEITYTQAKIKSRIFSFHWIDCTTFLICQTEGRMMLYILKDNHAVPFASFVLPPSKERWSTTAIFTEKNLVVGDRKGNLHLFEFGKLEPIQTLKKVHSHLGVTNLIAQNDKIISLGRIATIKIFRLQDNKLQLISSNKLPCTWLLNIVGDLLLAFSGEKFILWDQKTQRIIIEKSCGGGHRSWDFLKINDSMLFCYIKDKVIHVVDLILSNILPTDVIQGYQVKEINSIEMINVANNYIVVSGGEDTTLRLNVINGTNLVNMVTIKPHLSSIRTITAYKVCQKSNEHKETYLLFSGGGRAQIVCWKLEIFIHDHYLKDVILSEQHSYYKIIDNEESEMRIMDLVVSDIKNHLLLFAACSDGNIKIFFIDIDSSGKYSLRFYRDVFYKLKCILKLCIINIFSYTVLVTMATDGQLVFWDISDVDKNENKINNLCSIPSHQSGINSCSFKLVKDNLCLFLTGGDDNAVVLNLIRFGCTTSLTVENIHVFSDSGVHCAQITGVFLSDKYFITASIDQRIAIFEWELVNEEVICKYITKYNTAVADLHGLCCFENNDCDVLVYGKGVEYIKIRKK